MKTLILVRHAKSSWADAGMEDIDRPLNDRGKKDAPEMARRLKARGLPVDLFVASPAKRTRKTAGYFLDAVGLEKDALQIEPQLYAAPASIFEKVVAALDDAHETVVLFSHNTGITDYANSLTEVRTDNIPTCGVFAVQAATESWAQFAEADKTFLFFDYPKNPLAAGV